MNREEYDRQISRMRIAQTYEKKLAEEAAPKRLTADRETFLKSSGAALRATETYRELEAALSAPGAALTTVVRQALGWLQPCLNPELWDTLLYAAAHLEEIPYSFGLSRRGLRAADPSLYTEKLALCAGRLALAPLIRAPLSDVFAERLPEEARIFLQHYSWSRGFTEWQVAAALDRQDPEVETAVRGMLAGNEGPVLSRTVISGILLSHRQDLYAAVGELLLGAGLQEGLRQTVCECADMGNRDAFLYLLGLIREHDLLRFSSVMRAVGTWLGVFTEESRDLNRINRKSLDLLWDCLHDSDLRENCLTSRDAMAVYIGLWSLGFTDVGRAAERIRAMTDPQQLLAAGYFVQNLRADRYANRLAFEILRRPDPDLQTAAMWLPCFLSCAEDVAWWGRENRLPDRADWLKDDGELETAWQLIRSLRERMGKKELRFSPCLFPWLDATLRRTDLADRLCLLALWSGAPEKLAQVCAELPDCDLNRRSAWFRLLTREAATPLQRNTILDALADRESSTREEAISLARTMDLAPAEYARILPHLRLKNPGVRTAVMDLLLRQTDDALIPCLKDLLGDSKEEVRTAGLEMAVRCRKADRTAVTDALLPTLSALRPDSAQELALLKTLIPAADAPEEAPLCTEADLYRPTKFDPLYVSRTADRWEAVFPDSDLPALLRGRKPNHSLLEKLRDKDCPSRVQAQADLDDLTAFCALHEQDPYTDRDGERHVLGDGLAYMDAAPLEELWERWYADRGMTPERLFRILQLIPAVDSNPAADRCLRELCGRGFERNLIVNRSAPAYAVLLFLRKKHPLENPADLGAAFGLWYVNLLPAEEVMLPVASDRSRYYGSSRYDKGHLLADIRLRNLLGLLVCGDDDDLPLRFPIAAAVAEKSMAGLASAERAAESTLERRYSEVHRYRRALISSTTGMVNRDTLAGAPEYLLAAYRGIITPTQFFACLYQGGDLYRGMVLLTSLSAALEDLDRALPVQGSLTARYNRERIRLTEFYLGHPLPAVEADRAKLRFAAELCRQAAGPVVRGELTRGEGETLWSEAVAGILRLSGSRIFVEILRALGKSTLDRSAYYSFLTVTERKACLSHLLSACVPAPGETVEDLSAALDGSGIPKKRLIEAALYSPEWIDLIGTHLGIPGFRSACYYFMAHMNESFDDQRMAVIARFTPLSKEELNAGAVDLDWFRSAYESLGEKDFGLIYNAAKYISDGAKHTRARKYADAALGRYQVEELEQTIREKRNKDLLMAYPLIPLADDADLLRRYLFLQNFKKESRQFGAQRSASEALAADTAIGNLARNAGFTDPMRLILQMETRSFAAQEELLAPLTLEGVTMELVFDDQGKADLVCRRGERLLKSIPAALKKHPQVLARTEAKKAFLEQQRRSRLLLEQAMEDRVVFRMEELRALEAHPVVWPMLEKLVFLAGDRAGFLTPGGLADVNGEIFIPDGDASLRLAHPLDLYRAGIWQDFQKSLYERRIVQPFRQVFRELYVKTEEELPQNETRRYAGHQILPKKAAAVLKTRRWILDVENGLQKVYYKENLVACIWALADWFSPSDIEAPTLEAVTFLNRRTWERVLIRDVPDLIFSEVMRDVDLAVSVAHAGGVDPETSHSTEALRGAMITCLLPLLGLDNVRVENRHALIHGSLADYRVHLGSGVVHQVGGAMLPVLPVQSQHRGRVFLPFADDDPKTAEILSKVLLFAEDSKIRDPSILSMLRR